MPMTNYGALALTWQLGSNLSNNYLQYFPIGIGSSAFTFAQTTLTTETGTRIAITGSPNFSTARQISFQTDYSSVAMSGVLLTEFGGTASGAATVGSLWLREAFPSITFDGTNELQIYYTIQVIPG